MEFLLGLMVFILGLCFGSFINMLIYRVAIRYGLEKKKFKVKNKNRSFCDYCGKQLNWYENIPVFSWLIQLGKTRCCHKKLPISYPAVELSLGFLFLIYELKFLIFESNILFWVLGLIIIVFLFFSLVFDWKYMILPDFSTIILIVIAFLGVFFDEKNIISYLLSALIAAGFLLTLNLITRGKGMGLGDVKLALFIGLFLGYPKIIVAFYIAFIVGAFFGSLLMIFKKVTKKSQVPFGPFLILGTMIAWWWGEKIINLVSNIWY